MEKAIKYDLFDEPEKAIAVAMQEECSIEDVTEYFGRYTANGNEYMVLTDDEANDAWDQELDNYIDDCILPELPEYLQGYFDEEKWKRDARFDGRGHALSSYDGEENEQLVNDTWYYLYRTN